VQISELLDFATFANYGKDVNKEIEAEIFLNLLSDLGSTFYNRDMGTDAKRSLSRTMSFSQELKLQNQVIESMQNYNNTVDDTTERRIAVPADTVVIRDSDKGRGEVDIEMRYYRLRDLQMLPVRV
jgi:hypothetical protein